MPGDAFAQTLGLWQRRALAMVQQLVDAGLSGTLPLETFARSLEQTSGVDGMEVVLREYTAVASTAPDRDRYQRLVDLEQAKQALLSEAGGAVTADEAGRLLGNITRQAVEKRRERRGLLAVRIGGEYRYPLCQFADGDVLPGLPDVLRAFTVRSPWTQLSVLTGSDDALDGRSILDALRAGNVDDAVAVAENFGTTGA